ncbi:N-acetylmuramoyl-L-alanine amidase [Streptomyces aureocirculatus]|uniref:N-acetylmuramoyl-L-alanine amidase n=1 Tax=Streptomyces aureocirculatus TaxID=67275 RepID=UPI0004CBF60B|nr:N-acetylmuramoyl-L-alanine amidase [Streptomyces aureocirculatus]
MAPTLSPSRFLDALKDEGVTIVEVGDWRDNNRNHMGPWGPVHGVMIHHTVTSGSAATVRMCRYGHASLPGPLCHGVITKDGRVHLVGYGRANHAGLGDDDVLRAVISEKAPPADNEANTDGNRHFYGFECENLGDGEDPWPKAQVEAIVRVITALCRAHKWTVRSALRHLDWQPGKIDPRGPGLDWSDIQERAAKRLGTKPPGTPLPQPQRPKVSVAKLATAARTDPGAKGTPVSYSGTRIVEAALVDAGLLEKPLLDGHFGSATVTAYAAWQRRCGYSGKAADGIPGKSSLTRLGDAHGFAVTT